MSPLSKNDKDNSKKKKKQRSADNTQCERIEDITIDELPDQKSKVIVAKISKFAHGFKIPDDKKPKIK